MTYPSGKIRRFFRNDLIIMGDLPRWKNTKIFQKESHCNEWSIQVKKNTKKGSHYNEWLTQVEKYRDFSEKDLIVMGDLSK